MIGALIARQAVKSGFIALNDRNLDKFMKAWAEQSTWIYPGHLSVSGTFTGKENVKKWFEHFLEQFPVAKFDVKHLGVGNIFSLTGNNVFSVYWELVHTNKDGFNYHNSGITFLTIKGARVVQGEDFLFNSAGEDFSRLWGE
jgi:ketosteroid isomerase-like protein